MLVSRIYRIFGRRKLQVVKLSNARLLRAFLLILAGDVLYLIVWQVVAPMSAVDSTALEADQRYHVYRQCSYAASPTSLHLFTASAVIKLSWLAVGVLLAFSTRQVRDTFNESKSVGLVIYNVVFSLGLIVPLIMLIDAVGDTLSMLMTFCLLWISFFSLAILVLPKFMAYMSSTGTDVSAVHPSGGEPSASVRERFSFFSLTQLTSVTLATHYISALEQHVLDAKSHVRRLKASQGSIASPQASSRGSAPSDAGQSTARRQPSIIHKEGRGEGGGTPGAAPIALAGPALKTRSWSSGEGEDGQSGRTARSQQSRKGPRQLVSPSSHSGAASPPRVPMRSVLVSPHSSSAVEWAERVVVDTTHRTTPLAL